MYEKFDDVMKRTVRDETEYVKAGMEKAGEDYLSKRVGDNTGTRITLTDENGKVLYDSEQMLPNFPITAIVLNLSRPWKKAMGK